MLAFAASRFNPKLNSVLSPSAPVSLDLSFFHIMPYGLEILLFPFLLQSIRGHFLEFDFADLATPSSNEFMNGEYFGETACKETADTCSTPHGRGSYKRKGDGKILYDGQWHNGKVRNKKA